MKKLLILAIFLAVIGILCAVFFIHPDVDKKKTDEKPWTVGEQAESTEAVTETTKKEKGDPVSAFSGYIDGTLREKSVLLNEEETYTLQQLTSAVYGLYMYDADTDGAEELAVVRTGQEGICLDVYEYESGKVKLADTALLTLDKASDIVLNVDPSAFSHIAARLTIYPSGSNRYFCLTVEQQGKYSDYNAYTVIYEYAKGKLSEKQSFRLRRIGDTITLMRMGDATLLYRLAPTDGEETDAALAKYTDLAAAFKTEFTKYGLAAPDVQIENGTLTQYKVKAVPSEQHVFEMESQNDKTRVIENGFLQSFLIRH